MSRTRFAVLLLLTFALACDAAAQCDELPIGARVASADAVFVGRVLRVDRRVVDGRGVDVFPTVVERAWKGIDADTVTLTGAVDGAGRATISPGERLLVFAEATPQGYLRVSECLGSGAVLPDDPRLAMLDYVGGAGTMIVAAEGGGIFSGSQARPTFGLSLERAVVARVHARLRVSEGAYWLRPTANAPQGATGHAVAVELGVRGRQPLRWLGLMPFAALGVARIVPIDGIASTRHLDGGLWLLSAGIGIELPLAAQFGAFVESDVAVAPDGAAPRAVDVRVGLQVAL